MQIKSEVFRIAKQKRNIFSLLLKTYSLVSLSKRVKGSKNKIIHNNVLLRKVKISIKGNNNTVLLNEYSSLKNCTILITGDNHFVEIGEFCKVNNSIISFTHSNGKITLGDRTTISGSRIYSGESKEVLIGKDCMFSSEIDIRTTDSHSILSLDSKKRINLPGDVKVGNHVWLGNSCKLLKGADIGDNCVIGMGSTVTKPVSASSLAVGIPAKVIKNDITWDRSLIAELV